MAKRTVDYGTRVVEVEISPVLEQGSQEVAQQMGASIDNDGRIRTDPGKAAGRMRDVQFEQRKASMDQRLAASPPVPATVFNFLPVKLTVNSPMQAVQNGVPAVSGEARYAVRTWIHAAIEVYNLGDGGREPRDFHPLQIAQAFEHEYPHGGVVALPCKPEEVEQNVGLQRRLKDHEERAINWMRAQVAAGERLWNAPDRFQRRNVNNVHRACGQRLFDLKIIASLPEYMTAKRDLHQAPPTCGRCGTVADSVHTLQCVKCQWILDPAAAYEKGVISEDDQALERLTREEVKNLGISAYVAETADEKPERIKAGVPKPPSDVALALMAAEEESRQQPGA